MAKLDLAFDILARDKGASKTLDQIGDKAEKTGKRGEKMGKLFKVGLGLVAAGGAIAAATGGKLIQLGEGASTANARIGNIAESMGLFGDQAGAVTDRLTALAEQTARNTGVDTNSIKLTQAKLLTFKELAGTADEVGGSFDRATAAAVDMAAAGFGEASTNAVQLGKALNDPIKGITALNRSGVTFTEQEKEKIRVMVESGNVLGAQEMILSAIETQVGGTAEATANASDKMKVGFTQLGERLGEKLLPTFERFQVFVTDKVLPGIEGLISGFENGTGAGGRFREFLEGASATASTFAGWFRDEVQPRVERFGVWLRDEGQPRAKKLADLFRDEVSPRLSEFGAFLRDRVMPAASTVGGYLRDKFTPAGEKLAEVYREDIKPALDQAKQAIKDNEQPLKDVAKFVGGLMVALGWLHTEILSRVLPIVIDFAGYLGGKMITTLGNTAKEVGWLVDKVKSVVVWFKDAKTKATNFIDKIKDFKTPGWVKEIADAAEAVSGGFGNAAGAVGKFFGFGDAPGSFRGTAIGGGRQPQGYSGTALRRVQGAMIPGLRVTSTYRSPAHNKRVGGSPTSLHMDRSNPAVDIGGPTGLLDRFAGILRSMGGWRQLLWRVKGHFDHIHVAHQGGRVDASWPTIPGLRSDERPVIAQIGEDIIPKGQAGGRSVTYQINVAADSYLAQQLGAGIARDAIREARVIEARELDLVAS